MSFESALSTTTLNPPKSITIGVYCTLYMTGEDPKTLVLRAKEGDVGAFEELYTLFYTPVFRYIYLRTKNKEEAEDLAQTVFLKTFKSISRFETGNSAPLAYFFTVARNTVIDHWRKQGKVLYDDDIVAHKAEELVEERSDTSIRETKEIIAQAMEALTEDQKEVITYRFIHDLETKEICKITGKKEEAIRQLQSRGLKAMREHLKKNNITL